MREQQYDKAVSGPTRTDSGFSIIEMLIAISVIVFGLVSIVGISAYVSRTNSTSATLNVLAAAAQDQVDRLRTARWSRTYMDPMLSVGGSVPSVAGMASPVDRSLTGLTRSKNAGFLSYPLIFALPSPQPIESPGYTYTLDPNDPHHATATGTPAGDLNINWEVRAGATPDLRYVTIRVVQINSPAHLADGITVTTIIVRN